MNTPYEYSRNSYRGGAHGLRPMANLEFSRGPIAWPNCQLYCYCNINASEVRTEPFGKPFCSLVDVTKNQVFVLKRYQHELWGDIDQPPAAVKIIAEKFQVSSFAEPSSDTPPARRSHSA
eukprot:137413-Pyramimonas_sp.AAC.1